MPRLTRAQLKAQAEGTPQIHEDNESASETRQASLDSASTREVLKDITAINDGTTELSDTPIDTVPNKTNSKKGQKKNARKQAETPDEGVTPDVEVLEDYNQSDTSGAAETTAGSLRDNKGVTEPFLVIADTARSQTPTSPAVDEATRTLSKSPSKRTPMISKTPKFEPSEHTTPVMASASEHDSFAGTCQKASPFKHPMSQEPQEQESDSFLEQIISRSPSKRVSRIEDSVEAIDALEDAIEQVAGELPTLVVEDHLSPVKKSTSEAAPGRQSVKRKIVVNNTPTRSRSNKSLSFKTSPTKSSPSKSPVKEAVKSPLRNGFGSQKLKTAARPPVCDSSKPTVPSPSILRDIATSKLIAAATSQISFSNSPAKPRANMTHKRAPGSVLSSGKVPFVPKPSSKPTTTSAFTLPGDAVAAKLKTEREERQKRMEARENTKPVKPTNVVKKAVGADKKVPTAPSYRLPGDAVAAKLKAQREARLEREAAAEAEAKEKAKTFKARLASASRENKATTVHMSAEPREEGVKSRGSDKENIAPSRQTQAPIPKQRLEVKKIRNSISGKSANPAVIRRSMNMSNQNVQERKAEPTIILSRAEKEEAARRARAEAAERGRLASREWAEKQKKKMDANKVKSKGESALTKETADVMEVARLKGQVA